MADCIEHIKITAMKLHSLILFFLFLTTNLSAQRLNVPTLSPFSEIKQEIGLTEIQLSYARPSAKGRAVFGNLVPYGKMWRTGANASTKITVSETVKMAGNELPAGTYAIYTIPEASEWTIIIHKKTNFRSISGNKVKPENDAFRFKVKPIRNPKKIETFTIQFTDIQTKSCNIQLSWEHTIINLPVEVEVDSKIEEQMASLLKTPEKVSHRVYFRAAEYYLHNQKDLNQAMDWIDIALAKSANNFRYGLLKSKIYAAQGDKEKAIETVKTAHEWAKTANNANYMGQTTDYLAVLDNQKSPAMQTDKYAADVKSIDAILAALYDVISGEKGEKRDWDRFRNLFIKEAQLMPSGKGKNGKVGYRVLSPEDYIQNAGKFLEEQGFFEVEMSRKTEAYGSLVHAYSTYKAYHSKTDAEPFARGINSIQLMNDGQRWWVVSIYWLAETEALPLPKKYLPE
jgi:tetratricopeptide (TPR) repeat protein